MGQQVVADDKALLFLLGCHYHPPGSGPGSQYHGDALLYCLSRRLSDHWRVGAAAEPDEDPVRRSD